MFSSKDHDPTWNHDCVFPDMRLKEIESDEIVTLLVACSRSIRTTRSVLWTSDNSDFSWSIWVSSFFCWLFSSKMLTLDFSNSCFRVLINSSCSCILFSAVLYFWGEEKDVHKDTRSAIDIDNLLNFIEIDYFVSTYKPELWDFSMIIINGFFTVIWYLECTSILGNSLSP